MTCAPPRLSTKARYDHVVAGQKLRKVANAQGAHTMAARDRLLRVLADPARLRQLDLTDFKG